MLLENEYRTHNCSEFGCNIIGKKVRAAGWVENIRDHGGVIFIDLRDHYGVLQVVIHDETQLEGICRETVISVSGEIRKRDEETINTKIATGEVELVCENAMMSTVLDHFGAKIKPKQIDEDHFSFIAEVSLSPTFFAWIFEFGGRIRICGPQNAIDTYRELLEKSFQSIETT